MVSRTLCMYVCVLSLLAGTLTLLKLLFYGHCESFQFSELLLLFSSPHSFSRCLHFVSQKILWRAVLWVRSLETDLAFWSSGKSLWALSKKKGKREWKDEKRHFNECAKNRSHVHCLSGNVTGERNIWGHVREGKHEKILHIKTKYWFPAWVRVGLERPTTSAHSPRGPFFGWGRVKNK